MCYSVGKFKNKDRWDKDMNNQDKMFLEMIHSPDLIVGLLERLERLGLLSAFLEAGNETR